MTHEHREKQEFRTTLISIHKMFLSKLFKVKFFNHRTVVANQYTKFGGTPLSWTSDNSH